MDTKLAEFAQKLGARIVQLRKEHDFAQERLATLARMNKGYLSSVESGQRIPSLGMLAKLAKVLQVQVFDLFIFPDSGPVSKVWEEIRHGGSAAANQLRSHFGVEGQEAAKGSGRAAAASKVRPAPGKGSPAKGKSRGTATPTPTRTRTPAPQKAARTPAAKAGATKARRSPR